MFILSTLLISTLYEAFIQNCTAKFAKSNKIHKYIYIQYLERIPSIFFMIDQNAFGMFYSMYTDQRSFRHQGSYIRWLI